MIDVLHVLDHGLTTNLLGNVWWEVMQGLEGSTENGRLTACVADMKGRHSRNNLTLSLPGKLTIAGIGAQGDWPRMKAKAATVRHLVQFALDLARRYDSESQHDSWRTACCQVVDIFYGILEREGRWLTEEAKRDIEPSGQLFDGIYSQLSAGALAAHPPQRLWTSAQSFTWSTTCVRIRSPFYNSPCHNITN